MYIYPAGGLNNTPFFTVLCKPTVWRGLLEGYVHIVQTGTRRDTQNLWDEQEGDRRELNCGSESL